MEKTILSSAVHPSAINKENLLKFNIWKKWFYEIIKTAQTDEIIHSNEPVESREDTANDIKKIKDSFLFFIENINNASISDRFTELGLFKIHSKKSIAAIKKLIDTLDSSFKDRLKREEDYQKSIHSRKPHKINYTSAFCVLVAFEFFKKAEKAEEYENLCKLRDFLTKPNGFNNWLKKHEKYFSLKESSFDHTSDENALNWKNQTKRTLILRLLWTNKHNTPRALKNLNAEQQALKKELDKNIIDYANIVSKNKL